MFASEGETKFNPCINHRLDGEFGQIRAVGKPCLVNHEIPLHAAIEVENKIAVVAKQPLFPNGDVAAWPVKVERRLGTAINNGVGKEESVADRQMQENARRGFFAQIE